MRKERNDSSNRNKVFMGFFSTIFFFIFISLFTSEAKAIQCISYATCHYQSGTGLTCPSGNLTVWNKPFQFCTCGYNSSNNSCVRVKFNLCLNQTSCNELMRTIGRSCLDRYNIDPGDCCGCSGKPRLISYPTLAPKLTPVPGIGPCNQSCTQNSDCVKGLVCGYSQVQGKRTCQNPSCFNAPNCRCAWER